jgi:putative polysaccharide biosynthesis protein
MLEPPMGKKANSRRMPSATVAGRAERLLYRMAGLPVAVSSLFAGRSEEGADPLQITFARRYWHPRGAGEWSELIAGIVAWPLALLFASTWFTWRNGSVIRRRHGKRVPAQVREQLSLYFSAGVLPPWYYIFSLHDDGAARAATFIQRFETKPCYFPLLKRRKGSPLNDKARFAEFCTGHGLRCVETLVHVDAKTQPPALPQTDLFVKPVAGRGGTGAERWDYIAPNLFASPNGEQLTSSALLKRLVERSRQRPLLVQPRLRPHRELAAISTGALPTIRVVTCLDEQGRPEVVAAMLRSSIGRNVTVDNLHAGGMGALIDVPTGRLGPASDLGSDSRVGWFSTHPDTGAPVESRVLPYWDEAKRLAADAHRHFNDRVLIGWDVAILDDGPILIEGNGNPDLDILQRFMRIGFREHRLGELLRHHLRSRLPEAA